MSQPSPLHALPSLALPSQAGASLAVPRLAKPEHKVYAGLLLLSILCGCSGDYTRERGGIATDLHKYCLENPRDSACQGPNSK